MFSSAESDCFLFFSTLIISKGSGKYPVKIAYIQHEMFNIHCFVSSFEKEQDRQKYIYTKGCVGQFEKWLQDNLIFVAGIFVGIALLQVRLLSLQPLLCLKLVLKLTIKLIWAITDT